MMMHIFHYWIIGVGKHVNMSENGPDKFFVTMNFSYLPDIYGHTHIKIFLLSLSYT